MANSKSSYILNSGLIRLAIWVVITLIPISIYSSCKESMSDSTETAAVSSDNRSVIDWNLAAYTIANEHDRFYSFIGVRALAMVHIAIHDALNSIYTKYETYAFKSNEPEADPIAALSQAAYEVLIKAYPEKTDTLKIVLNKWLSRVPQGKYKTLGIELGKKSAGAIIKKREGDGHEKQGDYTPMTKPGDYQYTPGFDYVWKPDFSYARPFSLDSVNQFRSPPPPKLTTREYSDSYNEVKEYGVMNSKVRSKDQTNLAHWWAEFGEHGWNRIGRITAAERKLPILETARMFALINMDLYDIYLATFDSKYFYDTWRPYTAIRNGDLDGNPLTEKDTGWVPEMLTPPWPEYPSAHASVGAGGAVIVSYIYGISEISFEMESVMALPNAKVRSYNNLESAANDCADSRIMNGYHFRFSTEEGKIQGRKIARNLIKNFLRPLNEIKLK